MNYDKEIVRKSCGKVIFLRGFHAPLTHKWECEVPYVINCWYPQSYLFGRKLIIKGWYRSVDRRGFGTWLIRSGLYLRSPSRLHPWLHFEHDTISFSTFSDSKDHRIADDFLGSSVEKDTYSLEEFHSADVAREPLSKLNSEGQWNQGLHRCYKGQCSTVKTIITAYHLFLRSLCEFQGDCFGLRYVPSVHCSWKKKISRSKIIHKHQTV